MNYLLLSAIQLCIVLMRFFSGALIFLPVNIYSTKLALYSNLLLNKLKKLEIQLKTSFLP